MARKRICIIAKTYPRPSRKYDELVCTAGITAEGQWIRLYPVPFRKLVEDKQYSKFHWIECDIDRRQPDFRPESYRLRSPDHIDIVGYVAPDKDGTWIARRDLVLKNVYTNKADLLTDAYQPDKNTSLAVFKPSKMLGFDHEVCGDRCWDREKLAWIKARAQQVDLFAGAQNPFEVVEKIPYKFYYRFLDDAAAESRMEIIDWEIGQLFRHCRKDGEEVALQKVRAKYWDNFALKTDIHLILGTTLEFHKKRAQNPFLIIGVFPPKPELQVRLL